MSSMVMFGFIWPLLDPSLHISWPIQKNKIYLLKILWGLLQSPQTLNVKKDLQNCLWTEPRQILLSLVIAHLSSIFLKANSWPLRLRTAISRTHYLYFWVVCR